MTFATSRRALLARAFVVLLGGALVVGCTDEPSASAIPSPTRQPEPTPAITTFALDTTVWYEGLLIHVDQAVAELDQHGGTVKVSLRVENPAADPTDLNAPIRLLVGETTIEPTRESRVPSVPGNAFVGALMTYELQDVPTADAAVVLVGADLQHIARVPLSAAGGEPLSLEPVAVGLSGQATAGSLRVRLRDGVLRWDLPDWSQELPAGLQALTVSYDVTYLGTFSGGFAFTGDNVRLRLPSGKVIGPRRDGHSQSIELIGPGKTAARLSSRFEIPAGMTGRFALFAVDGSKRTGIPFTIR